MKPRYIIVNKVERDNFEMTWQLPYGYNNCLIFEDEDEAIKFYKDNIYKGNLNSGYILEKYNNGTKELICEKEDIINEWI